MNGEVRRLDDVLDDWQRRDFEATDPGWRLAAGLKVDGPVRQRAWVERGRGHSKSGDAMVSACWCLVASRRKLSGVVCAVDRDQAALDRDHVARFVALNPWLDSILEVQQWRVINRHTGSVMEFMASDVSSSYGLLIDFAVCDEVTLWPKRDLFDSILSASAKRSTCFLLCVGNAGFHDSWQWSVRESVRNDSGWYFNALAGPVASWITPTNLAEQRRLLPPTAFDRLWMNLWASAGGDALSEGDILAAFKPDLRPQAQAEIGWTYCAGLDVGVSRDCSAVVVLALQRGQRFAGKSHQLFRLAKDLGQSPGAVNHQLLAAHGRIRLAFTRLWRPTKGQKVNLSEVESALQWIHSKFRLRMMCFDPWQCTFLAQRLQTAGLGSMSSGWSATQPRNHFASLPMVEIPPTSRYLQAQATCLLEGFSDRRIELFDDPDLKRDLTRLRIEERPHGFRVVSPRDEHGHGDMLSAFQLALLAAAELAGKRSVTLGLSDGRMRDQERAARLLLEEQRQEREKQAALERHRENEYRAAFDNFFEQEMHKQVTSH